MTRISIRDNISALHTGMALLATLTLCFLLAAGLLMCGLRLDALIFPVACIAGTCIPLLFRHRFLPNTLLAIMLIIISIATAAYTVDFSFDGTFYHQEGILELAGGWNPWHDASVSSLWISHYAIGMEMMQACVYLATGSIESAKCTNLILILAATLIFAGTLRRFRPHMRRNTLILLSLLMALNPIGVAQLPTFYIDFSKYYLWIITLSATACMCRTTSTRERLAWCAVMTASSLLAFAIKFNIGFEQALLLISIFCWSFFYRPVRAFMPRFVLLAGLATVSLTLIFCSHPYLTNWIDCGHPLHPLCGDGKVDIMTSLTPASVAQADRFSAFFISLARPVAPIYDTRLGGFGLLMPVILILTVIVWIKYRHNIPRRASLVATFALVTCFLYPQSWWARYICQLWLVTVAICTPLALAGKVRRIFLTITVLSILNAMATAGRTAFVMARSAIWQHNIILATSESPLRISSGLPQFAVQAHRAGANSVSISDSIPSAGSGYVAIPWNPHMPDHVFVTLDTHQWHRFIRYQNDSQLGQNPVPLVIQN